MIPLYFGERASRRGVASDSTTRAWHLQRSAGRCDHGAFNHVLKLANVARPRIVSERVDDGVWNLLDALRLTLCKLSDEVCDQKRNIFGPLA